VLTTLFHIPTRIESGGLSLPLLGWGVLLAVWAVIGLAALIWTSWRHGMAAAVRSLAPTARRQWGDHPLGTARP
jgi:hypothetical protein